MVPYQQLDRRDVPNGCDGSIVDRGVIATSDKQSSKTDPAGTTRQKNAARKPCGILRILFIPVS
jgi:hypothetical protein